jgi:hypothetical protein
MDNFLRNVVVILHYPKEIFRAFCTYAGAILTNINYLIPDILKVFTNANNA